MAGVSEPQCERAGPRGGGGRQRQGPQSVREGKDHMDVRGVQHLVFPGGEPRGLRGAMACGAATVMAGVIRLDLGPPVVALGDMAPESSGPAHGNGPQGPVLLARQGSPITLEKGGAMLGACRGGDVIYHRGGEDLFLAPAGV